MEMNCTLFDELTSSYKADRQRWGTLEPYHCPPANVTLLLWLLGQEGHLVVEQEHTPKLSMNIGKKEGSLFLPLWTLLITAVRALIYECSSDVTCDLDREKKKEQERDELWKKLEELKLDNSTLFQNNSCRFLSVQNNSNSNNNISDAQDRSRPAAAVAADRDSRPDAGAGAGESDTCAK